MPIFTPATPNYAGRTITPGVQNGCGLLGLWPKPVYANDPRGAGCAEGGILGNLSGLFGNLFASPQPAYIYPKRDALPPVPR